MVYNNMDQVILTQDGNQREKFERSFMKYDGIGRVIMTGVETNHHLNRADLQTAVTAQTGPYFETCDPNGYYGYTNGSSPYNTSTIHPLVVNYYDNYTGITQTCRRTPYRQVQPWPPIVCKPPAKLWC